MKALFTHLARGHCVENSIYPTTLHPQDGTAVRWPIDKLPAGFSIRHGRGELLNHPPADVCHCGGWIDHSVQRRPLRRRNLHLCLVQGRRRPVQQQLPLADHQGLLKQPSGPVQGAGKELQRQPLQLQCSSQTERNDHNIFGHYDIHNGARIGDGKLVCTRQANRR